MTFGSRRMIMNYFQYFVSHKKRYPELYYWCPVASPNFVTPKCCLALPPPSVNFLFDFIFVIVLVTEIVFSFSFISRFRRYYLHVRNC